MITGAIDTSKIEAMMAQLKAASARAQGIENPIQTEKTTPKVDFADALKSSLDHVSQLQHQSNTLGQNFVMGDDKVSLSEVMISMQKANLSFQETIQVRNKLVAAYREIMSMQV